MADQPFAEDSGSTTPLELIRPYPVDDFLALDLPEPKPLLAPILTEHNLVMTFGARGIGKSWLVMALAAALSTGGELFGWNAPAPASTLLVDGEMHHTSLQKNCRRILQGGGYAGGGQETPLRILSKSLMYSQHGRGIPDLASDEGQHFVEGCIGDARVLVLDNISSLVFGGRENEAESWTTIQEWLIRLRSRGLAVIVVHHAGKSGDQRGTSKREDALDTVIKLSRPAGYNAEDGCRFELEFTKARNAFGPATAPLDVRLKDLEAGGLSWSWKARERSTFDQVLELHRSGMTVQAEIARKMGVNPSTVSRHIKKAEEDGLLRGPWPDPKES